MIHSSVRHDTMKYLTLKLLARISYQLMRRSLRIFPASGCLRPEFRGQSKNPTGCLLLSYILRVFTLTPPIWSKSAGITVLVAGLCLNAPSSAVTVVPSPPEVEAVSYLIVDSDSGYYLVEKNIDRRVEPASLTKMMTAYVAASQIAGGHIAMSDQVTVSERAWRMGGSRMFIEVGNQVSVEDLLKGVIIQSGNDASVALAEHISGTEEAFAELMNHYAAELGMKDTRFTNSSGWPDKNHYTTARDLATLARALIRDYPEVYALHSVREFTYNDIKQSNRNRLLWTDSSFDGIKTGHTESAGYCLVASSVRDGVRLISVVMGTAGTRARTQATQALLNYSYRFYETRKLYSARETVTNVKVWKGERDSLDLVVEDDLVLTLPRGQYDQIETETIIEENLIAPIETGQKLGQIELSLDEEVIATLPLVASETVAAGSLFIRLRDHIKMHWKEY